VLLSFPAEDPALIGRCYRQLIAPLSGPSDQDLRVVASMLRLSDAVAVVVSHVLISFSHVPIAAFAVALREFLRGVGKFLLRQSVVPGGAEATLVVAAMVAMMVMMAMVVMVMMVMVVMVLVVEQIVQKTSDETSRKTWQQTEHSAFSIVARGACACLMPTLRCLLTV
jgi:hypothetical protein